MGDYFLEGIRINFVGDGFGEANLFEEGSFDFGPFRLTCFAQFAAETFDFYVISRTHRGFVDHPRLGMNNSRGS